METIITIATVLTMYLNAATGVNTGYMYNADIDNGIVNMIEVYEDKGNNQLSAKMAYRYAYDEEGRLSQKEILRWDAAVKDWSRESRLTYKYYKNGYNVETACWDAAKKQYDLPKEVTLYREMAPSVTSVRTFRMNAAKNDMYLCNRMYVMESADSRLLAVK